ncbi:RNA polymerase sigma factor [Sutcliffiella halmapala]|uniref:RNA polymerase sigma factor n=1 Tax=Sutcliffiella halmapala TaxID=79882 RepID=UPI001F3E33C7|nr:RNA polymerase sigma factor [Sutcliffiella halmapala]
MKSKIEFSEVYSMFYKRLFQISYSITRDRHHAEDIVQETFIKALSKMETLMEASKIGAWLSVIATRTAIDFVRREKKRKGIPMELSMLDCLGKKTKQNVEEEIETVFLEERINGALRELTLEYQDVLILKLGQGLKEHEIAKVLDLKPCTVKTRIYRARKQLKCLVLEQMGA